MFRLFTSSSDSYSWQRILKDVAGILLILICLEGFSRIAFVDSLLSEKLDSYENLLWWDSNMPRYSNDLRENPDYTFWFLGSSYMMTAIEPLSIEESLNERFASTISTQNFGFTLMTNLNVMSRFHDEWFLEIDQPQVMVLFVAENNFSNPQVAAAMDGAYERTIIFPDSLAEYAGKALYQNSHLYRYLLLSRNLPLIPVEDTLREPRSYGGYSARQGVYDCSNREAFEHSPQKFERGLQNLDAFIQVAENRGLPLIIVNIPYPSCTILKTYDSFEEYQNLYLNPLQAFVESRNIPFYELDSAFHASIPAEEQVLYFNDAIHTNETGAALLSEWTSEILASWLELHPEYLRRTGDE